MDSIGEMPMRKLFALADSVNGYESPLIESYFMCCTIFQRSCSATDWPGKPNKHARMLIRIDLHASVTFFIGLNRCGVFLVVFSPTCPVSSDDISRGCNCAILLRRCDLRNICSGGSHFLAWSKWDFNDFSQAKAHGVFVPLRSWLRKKVFVSLLRQEFHALAISVFCDGAGCVFGGAGNISEAKCPKIFVAFLVLTPWLEKLLSCNGTLWIALWVFICTSSNLER